MTQQFTQEIYGLVSDRSDGSAEISWFRNKDIANYLVSNKYHNQQTFSMNEGYINKTLKFPEDLNLEQCGFRFSDEHYKYVIDPEDEY